MAKKTFSDIFVGEKSKAYNCSKYTKAAAMEDYRREVGEFPDEDYVFVSYYRYITKQEVIDNGDFEEISGYEDGSMELFEECFENAKGAFKCWVIEN